MRGVKSMEGREHFMTATTVVFESDKDKLRKKRHACKE